mgnify:CR=1 FL=1
MFAPELAPVLAELYDDSLREGYLPLLLKRAIGRPLPKQSPARTISDDVRAISLTCKMAKLMEGFTPERMLPDVVSSSLSLSSSSGGRGRESVLRDLDAKQFAVAGKSTCHIQLSPPSRV